MSLIYIHPNMDNQEIWKIIHKYFEDNPQTLVRHHIDSYDDFFKKGIYQVFKNKNPLIINTMYDEQIKDYKHKCIMHFGGKNADKIYFGKPVIYDDNNSHYMFPNEARMRNMTYGMTIHYDIEIEIIDLLEEGEQPQTVFENIDLQGGAPLDTATYNIKEIVGGDVDITLGSPQGEFVQEGGVTVQEFAAAREELEKSMVAPNKQVRTITLDKILLGRFPIMVQSSFCVLNGLPRDTKHMMGECKNDIGGYFIIAGKEKTVVPQEKFGNNMLYIKKDDGDYYLYSAEIRSVSEDVSKPIRTLSVKIQADDNVPKNYDSAKDPQTGKYMRKNMVVNLPNVRKPVPLFILFRALGVLSDKEIIETCLLDLEKYEGFVDLFIPSVYDAGNIYTQRQAMNYIRLLTKKKTMTQVLEILTDYLLPHIGELNFKEKAYYLGHITLKLLLTSEGFEKPTDRDNYKFKRVDLVGDMLYDLFREYYSIQTADIHREFERKITYDTRENRNVYENNLYLLIQENKNEIFKMRPLEKGFTKAFKGNWGAHSHTKRVGAVQDLNRLSFNSVLSHLRKTNLPLDASAKVVGPRLLNCTQWGFFDPIDTPDGGNIGIHKHMSISTHVTKGYSRESVIQFMIEKMNLKRLYDCTPLLLSRLSKVIVNGCWIGSVENPIDTVSAMKFYRRNGLIPTYTSISFDVKDNTLYVYTDGGRVCRPIFYKDEDTKKMSFESEHFQKRVAENNFSWSELVGGFTEKKIDGFHINDEEIYNFSDLYENVDDATMNPATIQKFKHNKAIIDYIDTSETEQALIALDMEATKKKDKLYTHMEIHQSLIFGIMCNQINFLENNPATRNSFSCGQTKQACSIYHTNYQVRMDKTALILNYGQTPLVKTRYLEYLNREENPYGENAIVAIMCYTGYNVEDAILVNEGALKRGLFRTTYFTTYEAHEEKEKLGEITTQTTFSNIENDMNLITKTKQGHDYSKLDEQGIVKVNTEVNDETIMIGMVTSSSEDDMFTDHSKTTKKGQLGIVDKTFITDDEEGRRIAKVRVREERIPNLGDKMASRAGQKGTIGMVIPECDMPFTKDGIRPDLIINPHAIPSRMTIGQFVEAIMGKACAMKGGFGDCTAYNNNGSKVGVFGKMLSDYGYHSSGNEVLYNGMSGEQVETEIFMGPTYYMRLKHMVKDKINHRPTGRVNPLTKQPVAGRANDGGLRIGEMERDGVISHGATEFLRESMMERADKYYMAICNTTGMIAVYNPDKNLFMSPLADGPIQFAGSVNEQEINIEKITKFGRSFSIVCVPYSFKLLMQELQTINVNMRIITEDNINQIENMTFSKNIQRLMHAEHLDTKETLDQIQKDVAGALRQSNENKFIIEDAEIDTPIIPSTPEMPPPNESPEYQPITPDMPPPAESPEYQPITPEMNPPGTPEMNPPGTPEYGIDEKPPSSYASSYGTPPPPPSQPESNPSRTFKGGDRVIYGKDNIPGRSWVVTPLNKSNLYKIESEGANSEVEVVTALDLKPYETHIPFPGYGASQQGQLSAQMPSIHISPVFHIPGSVPSQSQTSSSQDSVPMQFTSQDSVPTVQTQENVKSEDSIPESKMDFSNLIIKKV
uniref:DNA-directed RNA polymerase n=1 Tax=viral metagenome TaxID=1070528 RepID=A0A6C0IJB7_9ZZZZ